MEEFKPSRNFVSRVMADVRAYDSQRAPRSRSFLSTGFARYALSAGGGLLGLVNIVRLCQTLFSPVLCR